MNIDSQLVYFNGWLYKHAVDAFALCTDRLQSVVAQNDVLEFYISTPRSQQDSTDL